jgi:hypothetical protein
VLQGQHPDRLRISRSPGGLWTRRGHRRIDGWKHHQSLRNAGHDPMDGTGDHVSREIRLRWQVQETASVKEHGYLRTRYDGPRGERFHISTIPPTEVSCNSLGRSLRDVTRSVTSPRGRPSCAKSSKGADRTDHLQDFRISCGNC